SPRLRSRWRSLHRALIHDGLVYTNHLRRVVGSGLVPYVGRVSLCEPVHAPWAASSRVRATRTYPGLLSALHGPLTASEHYAGMVVPSAWGERPGAYPSQTHRMRPRTAAHILRG